MRVSNPKANIVPPIIFVADFLFASRFAWKAPNGVANNPLKITSNARFKSNPPAIMRYIINPSADNAVSEKEVTATALLVSLPVIICPEVTTGPKPPPEMTLLKALIPPTITSSFIERRNSFRTSIITPIAEIMRPM